ncbi:Late embryogenesis abundant hydroxyproline-rich glycoprotein family [Heracleum sosnowskyi]|uniref:Late embryogenesis abundant hydroxyproline-rich glycoprotein family n=1 Tax=Heracleum sosnowskyi TaxID=360622 RepID=A0AAD8NDF0_9APIA|nr:Late embryogenesis abundant hydroxyproline-rich glycoprotein family [Heracleum sosnowskyi]
MGRLIYLCSYLFIFLAVASVVRSDDECVYTVYIRTGSVIKGGTDSKMTLTLYAADGYGIRINNLETWGGLMGPDYDYFERGHGWYCNYIEVTTTGAHIPCAQQLFTVEQWIALDRSPYELTAIRDYCSASNGGDVGRKMLKGGGNGSYVRDAAM